MARQKKKPITAAELAGMSHDDLATVKTKRRVMAALRKPKPEKAKPATEEGLRPRDRLRRAHSDDDGLRTRQARRGELNERGASDGD